MMVRQLEFSLFDFELHATHGDGRSVLQVLEGVRDEVSVMRPPAYNRFPNSFAHIFAGGYAAGYYSYKWAEVHSADSFSMFEEEGVIIMGNEVVQTLKASGTDTGGLFTGQPSRKRFQTRAVLFLVVKNNQILHERRIYDFSGVLLQRLEDELKTAAQIQQALQPVGCHSGVGFDVAAVSIPCRKIGGD